VNVTRLVLRNYGETIQNLGNRSGAVNLDLDVANVFTVNITGNSSFTVSNVLTGATTASSFTLYLRNNSANLSVSWPTNFKFPNGLAPVRTLEASRTDVWIFVTPDQGTTWFGAVALYNYST
jgi:hypothetical protein